MYYKNGPHKWRSSQIEQIATATLKPNPNQARLHPASKIKTLAGIIKEVGFIGPIIVDNHDTILCGHARLAAAKLLGYETVPTIRVGHLTEAQQRAFVLADNKISELSTWDKKGLARELRFLAEFNYEINLTAFEAAEIDVIFGAAEASDTDPADDFNDFNPALPVVAMQGDLWSVGRHRIGCFDARVAGSYETLLGTEHAQMIVCDSPYNVRINGHVSGQGRHREFAMASGEMSDSEFQHDFLEPTFRNLAAYSTDGSIHFAFIDWRHAHLMHAAGAAVYSELKNICIWVKSQGGLGGTYRSRHEMVFMWKSGTERHINNVKLGRHGRNRTNVWEYPGTNGFGPSRASDLAMHPTVKPVALVADAILDCSKPGGIILDPFGGSGTTVIAAERTKRRAAVIEIEPGYVDTAIRRWQTLTGGTAVDAFSGQSFAQREEQAHASASRTDHEPRQLSITQS